MLERMKRRGFLKAALGGAAAVALGEMGFGGKAEAARVKTCQNARYACRGGCDEDCQYQCSGLSGCTACDVCTVVPVDPCLTENAACAGPACTLTCLRACGRTGDNTCEACAVCAPPE